MRIVWCATVCDAQHNIRKAHRTRISDTRKKLHLFYEIFFCCFLSRFEFEFGFVGWRMEHVLNRESLWWTLFCGSSLDSSMVWMLFLLLFFGFYFCDIYTCDVYKRLHGWVCVTDLTKTTFMSWTIYIIYHLGMEK